MIELFPLENYPALRSSRRVLRYVVVWCASGEISLQIDENQYVLRSDEVVTITSGQVHFLQKEENAVGWALEFSLDFFCKYDTDIELIFHNGLFCHFAQNEVIPVHDRQTVNNIFFKKHMGVSPKAWRGIETSSKPGGLGA
ncbi:MAG: AraC family ligand binding domain-containing protein [Saprospiraceae bacterium]|nr:AraC family ligand binding domain-containing protein [Saprospiraceae bacterium]